MIGRLITGVFNGGLIGILIGAAVTALMLLGPGLKRPPLVASDSAEVMGFLAYICTRLAVDCAIIGAVASLISWWEITPDSSRSAINAGALTGATLGIGYGLWSATRGIGPGAFLAEALFWGIANTLVGAIVGATVGAARRD